MSASVNGKQSHLATAVHYLQPNSQPRVLIGSTDWTSIFDWLLPESLHECQTLACSRLKWCWFLPSQLHGKKILKLLQKIFSWLPLATVIDQKVLIVHGGISDTTDLNIIAKMDRQRVRQEGSSPTIFLLHDAINSCNQKLGPDYKHVYGLC